MKKMTAKIIFDMLLAALWIVLMIYSFTGPFWHEVIGTGILALFIIHIGYNIPLLKRTKHNMFKKGHGLMTFKYMSDIVMTGLMLLTIISGILISKQILTSVEANNIALWTWIHNWAAYLSLIIMSIHVGLHWQMVTAVIFRPFKKLASSPAARRVGKIGWNLAAVGVMIYGLMASVNYDIPAYTAAASTQNSNNTNSSDHYGSGSSQSDDNYYDEDDNDSSTLDMSTSSTSSYDTASTPTLEKYLGNLICTGCHRQCSLLSPQCSVGAQQASQAEQEYNSTYGSDSSQSQDNSSGSSSDNSSGSSGNSDNSSGNSDNSSGSSDNSSGNSDNSSGSSGSSAETWDDSTSSGSSTNTAGPNNSIGNVLPIMGLYVGGTFYVTKLTGRRKRKTSEYQGKHRLM